MEESVIFVLMMVVLFLSLLLYFLPTIIACLRSHVNSAAIFILNLFLGWSFVGWVIALVWAVMHQENRKAPIELE